MTHETESSSPAPVYQLLDGTTEATAAIEKVINSAQRELRIFDANPRTLRERGFGSIARIDRLRQLLLASRGHSLHIALHDTSAIESELPRLINLLTQFSGQIRIHRTLEQAAEARDPMIIADDSHFWRRPHIDHPRSVLTLNNAPDTRPFLDRFEEIWEKSELAISGSTLGL
ncbi:MAG: hypothetical protein JNN20_18465 [Betaproteobacteria bacterium]|nr:hypothetical protein [Betaproteobacteria bacterium]